LYDEATRFFSETVKEAEAWMTKGFNSDGWPLNSEEAKEAKQ